MIKGGFQGLDISGVDLTAQSPTLPCGYAACQAAEGKTVLVLTAAGAVQCSVKKVSTNYVLAGITGDGKILSITIGSTDGISVSETEIPGGGVQEEYLDDRVSIKTSTQSAPYTTEYDGIVQIVHNGSSALKNDANVRAKMGATHSVNHVICKLPSGAVNGNLAAIFVKKDTIVFCENVTSDIAVDFYPYKPVQS